MSNKAGSILIVLALIGTLSATAYADENVSNVFNQLDKDALQEWHAKPITDQKQAKEHAKKTGDILASRVHNLAPNELVELIKRCKQKIHEIPSDSKHERYFNYFEQAIAFSIDRLGEQKTAAAIKAMDSVKPIISGAAHLQEVWDEAKAKQDAK